MSEEGGDNIIDGILIVLSGALFTLGALAITAAWGKGSRMLRERRGIPIWKRTNKTGIQKPYFHTTAHHQEEGRWGRLPGEGILLEARGFPKGKRTNNDGSHNATFINTHDQQKAKDEGRWGRPLGSKNKPKK